MTDPWLLRWKTCWDRLARRRPLCWWLGLVAIAFWCTHATAHFLRGTPEHLLWSCNAAGLGVGVGLLLGRRWLNAAATLLLIVGTPSWFFNLFVKGTFLPTSLLTHFGGLVLGLVGLGLLGPPKGDWWKAWLLVALLMLISPGLTAKADNVNLVNGIWPQTTDWWPVPGPPMLAQLAAWAILLWMLEFCLRQADRFIRPRPKHEQQGTIACQSTEESS